METVFLGVPNKNHLLLGYLPFACMGSDTSSPPHGNSVRIRPNEWLQSSWIISRGHKEWVRCPPALCVVLKTPTEYLVTMDSLHCQQSWTRNNTQEDSGVKADKQCSINSWGNAKKKKKKACYDPYTRKEGEDKYIGGTTPPGLWVREFNHSCGRLWLNIILLANIPSAPFKLMRGFCPFCSSGKGGSD